LRLLAGTDCAVTLLLGQPHTRRVTVDEDGQYCFAVAL
jgi:hypothetical protein